MRNAKISLAVLSALALALAACSPQATLPGQGDGNSKSPDAIGQSAAAAKGESQVAKAGAAAAEQAGAGDEASYPEVEAELTYAPNVPKPIDRKTPATVKVNFVTLEKVGRLADGVDYTFWTFNGGTPGPFIRVREGDMVDFTLANDPSSKMPHNIDLHAVTGPGGGAVATFTAPGHQTNFKFKALVPGLFVYHCATAPVGMHIANGMYGLILVEPKEGLEKVDREFYVMQGDFYTKGKFGEPGLQPFDMEKAIREEPDYVVFNGSVGAISGKKALRAKGGETVRLFIGNGGPNMASSFHVIGEIFDKVNVEGGTLENHNVQTTLIPAGGAAVAKFKVEVPGTFTLVDHSIFRAFNKGALGELVVEGPDNPNVFSGQLFDKGYRPEGGAIRPDEEVAAPARKAATNKAERIEMGKAVFESNCAACHQETGLGLPDVYPPLAGSSYLKKDLTRGIWAVAHGLEGKITVNGKTYESLMPPVEIVDEDIANVVTYVGNAWGNDFGEVSLEAVRKVRAAEPSMKPKE